MLSRKYKELLVYNIINKYLNLYYILIKNNSWTKQTSLLLHVFCGHPCSPSHWIWSFCTFLMQNSLYCRNHELEMSSVCFLELLIIQSDIKQSLFFHFPYIENRLDTESFLLILISTRIFNNFITRDLLVFKNSLRFPICTHSLCGNHSFT